MFKILREAGYEEAMLGLSLSYNKPIHEMYKVSKSLYNKDGGHNKFLESIIVWLDIDAPRYWWQEFDTYRVGTTKQSGSTMHTIFKDVLTQDNFVGDINEDLLSYLNNRILDYKDYKTVSDKEKMDDILRTIKTNLPEGFLQRRIVCTNYKVLQNIIKQRKNHRLKEWQEFCDYLKNNCRYKEFLI